MMMRILLFGRPVGDNMPFLLDVTPYLTSYKDTLVDIGGCHTATGVLVMERQNLIKLYNLALGGVLRRYSQGIAAWEGMIFELRLKIGSTEYVRTLASESFHNRVKVLFSEAVGERSVVDWAGDPESQRIFGVSEYVISLSGATRESAETLQAKHIQEYSFPTSRLGGAISNGRGGNYSLEFLALGFWHTLNWHYREGTLTKPASEAVSVLACYSQFFRTFWIEDNSLIVRCDAFPIPQRVGDLLGDIAEQGDSFGNRWKVGGYPEFKLIYEPVPQTPKYIWAGDGIYESCGTRASLTKLRPGVWVVSGVVMGFRDSRSPAGGGAEVGYVKRIETSLDGTVALIVDERSDSVSILGQQIQRGNFQQPRVLYTGS